MLWSWEFFPSISQSLCCFESCASFSAGATVELTKLVSEVPLVTFLQLEPSEISSSASIPLHMAKNLRAPPSGPYLRSVPCDIFFCPVVVLQPASAIPGPTSKTPLRVIVKTLLREWLTRCNAQFVGLEKAIMARENCVLELEVKLARLTNDTMKLRALNEDVATQIGRLLFDVADMRS